MVADSQMHISTDQSKDRGLVQLQENPQEESNIEKEGLTQYTQEQGGNSPYDARETVTDSEGQLIDDEAEEPFTEKKEQEEVSQDLSEQCDTFENDFASESIALANLQNFMTISSVSTGGIDDMFS